MIDKWFTFRDELKLGHARNQAFHAMEQVLLGDKRENVRAQLPASGLTVEQQVAALIDQATDPNILGRVWAGWEPWMWNVYNFFQLIDNYMFMYW